MNTNNSHQSALRKGRFSEPGRVYSITKCVDKKLFTTGKLVLPSDPVEAGRSKLPLAKYTGRSKLPLAKSIRNEDVAPTLNLIHPDIAKILIDTLIWHKDHKKIRLGGFVIMPDHYHLIIALVRDNLSAVMKTIDSFTARKINTILRQMGRNQEDSRNQEVAPTGGQFWQRGYYDHLLRHKENFIVHLNYIHNNPVRKGYVERMEMWPFSTANTEWTHLIDWEWFR